MPSSDPFLPLSRSISGRRISRRSLGLLAGVLASAGTLAACSDPSEATPAAQAATGGAAITYDTSAAQTERVKGTYDAALAASVPPAVRSTGNLIVGTGGVAGGSPPLVFVATDNLTPIGVEVDIAHLVADILGLKVQTRTTSFENLFVGLDAGTYHVGAYNVGVSEARKQKYDFATYRLGLHAFEAKLGSTLKVTDAADISGKKVGVSSGTLQEAVLLRWNDKNAAAGAAPAQLLYFQNQQDAYLALQSGRLDLWLGPNPTATYHVATAHNTVIVGTVSSSYPIKGLVGVITKKDNGLVTPINAALNEAIADGSYARTLARWGLSAEAVAKSEINPAGLPLPAKK